MYEKPTGMSVTLTEQDRKIVQRYARENQLLSFSMALRFIIRDWERRRKQEAAPAAVAEWGKARQLDE